jgi:GT2 family glycosyltransferase
MSNPKVLLGCPTFHGMKYCHNEYFESIRNLTYDNFDTLIVENSENDDYYNELKKEKDIILMKDPPSDKVKMKVLADSRNIIINYAIENNYDYLFSMDPDVIAPKNIIEELLSCNKDIISGVYYNYVESSGQTKFLPVAFQFISPEEFEIIKKTTQFPPSVKSSEDLRRHLTEKEIKTGEVLKIKQPSIGCTLTSRKAFKVIKHGLFDIQGVDPSITGEDAFYFNEARNAGFDLFINTKMKCDHLVKGKYIKDEDGNLVHPLFK